jgi:phage/plasmid primase-like uncharacterized protein
MPYKTFNEQIAEHVNYLQSQGLDVAADDLQIDTPKWVRCKEIGQTEGRPHGAYITTTEKLHNGLCGMKTTSRGSDGIEHCNTYGLWPDAEEKSKLEDLSGVADANGDDEHEVAARKAYGFWQFSNVNGRSDYLERKGVGSYGIRFRNSAQYGNTAVVPMYDEYGRLWSYQLLNPDGTKRMPKDARTDGLFHMLKRPTDGRLIGIAEGYATAATCLEVTGIPTVCAFSSENLTAATEAILNLFPASPIVLFADNDRHLSKNIGLTKAKEAQSLNPERITIAIPDFGDVPVAKDASDWNDLARIRGRDVVKNQIQNLLKTKTMAAMGD